MSSVTLGKHPISDWPNSVRRSFSVKRPFLSKTVICIGLNTSITAHKYHCGYTAIQWSAWRLLS